MTFSPSQTTQYMTCPTLHHLSRVEGWRPKVLGKRDAAAIVGSAFAVGIARHNMHRHITTELVALSEIEMVSITDETPPATAAERESQRQIARLLAAGCVIPPQYAADFDYAPTIAARTVERVCADDPIPSSWTIVDVERAFPEHGNARPDLVVREADGALAVVDYKCKMAKPRYKADAEILAEYDRSWQLAHYLWAATQVYGEPVTRAYIAMVRIEPFKRFALHPVTFSAALMDRWHETAMRTWFDMTYPVGTGRTMNWTNCETKFGPCEMQAACWRHELDEALMAADYVRIQREEAV